MSERPKILVIRRDNIGDLVCTTPLLAALRKRFPEGWIGALVNSYNAPVLDGNPDVDEVFVYTKAKHRSYGQPLISILWERFSMMRRLRALKVDDVIIATTSPQPRTVALARWIHPHRIIGFGNVPGLDISLQLSECGLHEVEDVFRAAALYGIAFPPPPCRVVGPANAEIGVGRVGIHISARKPSQRWPADRFAALIRRLNSDGHMVRLLWSPGDENNPQHPGDDAKARDILNLAGAQANVEARPTTTLAELISAIADCEILVCADGGAMHLAAGLGLPIVCLFGKSDSTRWRPWNVDFRLLQTKSLCVTDISIAEVSEAIASLYKDRSLINTRRRRNLSATSRAV